MAFHLQAPCQHTNCLKRLMLAVCTLTFQLLPTSSRSRVLHIRLAAQVEVCSLQLENASVGTLIFRCIICTHIWRMESATPEPYWQCKFCAPAKTIVENNSIMHHLAALVLLGPVFHLGLLLSVIKEAMDRWIVLYCSCQVPMSLWLGTTKGRL